MANDLRDSTFVFAVLATYIYCCCCGLDMTKRSFKVAVTVVSGWLLAKHRRRSVSLSSSLPSQLISWHLHPRYKQLWPSQVLTLYRLLTKFFACSDTHTFRSENLQARDYLYSLVMGGRTVALHKRKRCVIDQWVCVLSVPRCFHGCVRNCAIWRVKL